MSQSSYIQNNKRNKRQYDDAGFEEKPARSDKKKKRDFSQERKSKRGEIV